MNKRLRNAILLIIGVLLVDQLIKIWVKTHMYLGQENHIFGDWFIIHFVENNGMAFGMEFTGGYGKLILSIFRILAIGAIGWYMVRLSKKKAKMGLILAIALVFAGAFGNIIDSAFYGMIFNESSFQIANMFPEGGGYGSFLHGKVVDMFYFPIIKGHYPSGKEFIFFRPIFNIADSAITIGVAMLIIFQRRYFGKK